MRRILQPWEYEEVARAFGRAVRQHLFKGPIDGDPLEPKTIMFDARGYRDKEMFVHCWVDSKDNKHDDCITEKPTELMGIFPYLRNWPCKCGMVVWQFR